MPERIQLRRAKGWRMPENAVKVDRSSKWGNPFIINQDNTHEEYTELYRALLSRESTCLTCEMPIEDQRATQHDVRQQVGQLRTHDLACWCPLDHACHADELQQLVDAPIGAVSEQGNDEA